MYAEISSIVRFINDDPAGISSCERFMEYGERYMGTGTS